MPDWGDDYDRWRDAEKDRNIDTDTEPRCVGCKHRIVSHAIEAGGNIFNSKMPCLIVGCGCTGVTR
jgi:hypothetical protein